MKIIIVFVQLALLTKYVNKVLQNINEKFILEPHYVSRRL